MAAGPPIPANAESSGHVVHSLPCRCHCLLVWLLAPGPAAGQGPTQTELNAAGSNPGDWLLTGHDSGGQRFVDLDQITRDNIGSLRTVCTFEPGYRAQWHATRSCIVASCI